MNKQGKDKRSAIETDSENTSYKHKRKGSKYPNSESSSDIRPRSRRERQCYISDSSESDRKLRRKKYRPYE